jgi:hypothetical protein
MTSFSRTSSRNSVRSGESTSQASTAPTGSSSRRSSLVPTSRDTKSSRYGSIARSSSKSLAKSFSGLQKDLSRVQQTWSNVNGGIDLNDIWHRASSIKSSYESLYGDTSRASLAPTTDISTAISRTRSALSGVSFTPTTDFSSYTESVFQLTADLSRTRDEHRKRMAAKKEARRVARSASSGSQESRGTIFSE